MGKEYKLTYFASKGRGEFLRILLAACGVDFEDERIPHDQWEAFKDKTPMKSLPTLTVMRDGKEQIVCQSNCIARYLAKKYQLYGADPWEDLLMDEVVDSVNDMLLELVKWFTEKDETKKEEAMKSFVEKSVPKFVNYFNLRQKQYGKNGYVIGSKLSYADIRVFSCIDLQNEVGNNPFMAYKELTDHFELVKSDPKIAAYLQARDAK